MEEIPGKKDEKNIHMKLFQVWNQRRGTKKKIYIDMKLDRKFSYWTWTKLYTLKVIHRISTWFVPPVLSQIRGEAEAKREEKVKGHFHGTKFRSGVAISENRERSCAFGKRKHQSNENKHLKYYCGWRCILHIIFYRSCENDIDVNRESKKEITSTPQMI